MTLLPLLAVLLAAAFGLMFVVWLVSVRLHDVSIVDIFWGPGFALIAVLTALLGQPGHLGRQVLLLTLTTFWALRLAAYLAWRKAGTPEDHRYRAMRETFGPRFWLTSLFIVFWLQAAILIVVALPLVHGLQTEVPLGGWAAFGTALWMTGFLFESIGDYQLARFKADPAHQGKVLDQGLWRYTRHPNYFGDFLVWWGIYFAAVTEDTWWTAVGPLVMSILLMRVSGVTLLERTLRRSKDGYADYVARTNAFFPWRPRSLS